MLRGRAACPAGSRLPCPIPGRGGRVAEGTRLLSEYGDQTPSRVRIPPSPSPPHIRRPQPSGYSAAATAKMMWRRARPQRQCLLAEFFHLLQHRAQLLAGGDLLLIHLGVRSRQAAGHRPPVDLAGVLPVRPVPVGWSGVGGGRRGGGRTPARPMSPAGGPGPRRGAAHRTALQQAAGGEKADLRELADEFPVTVPQCGQVLGQVLGHGSPSFAVSADRLRTINDSRHTVMEITATVKEMAMDARPPQDPFTLAGRRLGALPLINGIAGRMGLARLLDKHMPLPDVRMRLTPATVIQVVIANLVLCHRPLYALAEWAAPYAPRLLGLAEGDAMFLTDARVGRALDLLFDADRGALLTELLVGVVGEFGLDLSQLHNDSTSIKLQGELAPLDGRN